MIFRDDDISVMTDLAKFKRVHEVFEKYGTLHTIAVIAKDIENNKALVKYIRSRKLTINVQLHGWEHIDYAINIDRVTADLTKGAETLEHVFGKRPIVFYPPWNSVNDTVIKLAGHVGLSTSYKKISLGQYLRVNGQVKEDTINFHYWADQEAMMIEPALKIYTDKK